MQQRLIYWLVSGVLIFLSSVAAAEQDAPRQGANYVPAGYPSAKLSEDDLRWVQQEVLPKTAEALAYFGDNKSIPAVAAGILHVLNVEERWLSLGGVWLRSEDFLPLQEAEKYFTSKIEREATAFAYAMRGRARADLGRLEEAIADCNAALRLDGGCALAYCHRGWAHAARLEYKLAVPDYSEAIRLDPKLAAAHAWRGRARVRLGDTEAAVRDFDNALKLFPGDLATENRRCLATGEGGVSFFVGPPPRPRDAEDYYFRAVSRDRLKQYENELLDLNEALRLGLDTPGVRGFRAYVNVRRGALAEAIADYDVAIENEKTPRAAGLFLNRGLAYGELGEYRKAVANIRQALDSDPQAAESIDDCWSEVGPFQERIEESKQDERDIELPLAYCVRAMVWISKGEDEDAIDDLTAAIRLNPRFAVAFCLRGWLRRKAGQQDEAMRDFSEALRFDDHLTVAAALKQLPPIEPPPPIEPIELPVARIEGLSDDDLEAANEAIRKAPDDPSGYEMRAWIWTMRNEWEKALADRTKVLELRPDDTSALQARGLALCRAGHFQAAIRDYDKLISIDPNEVVHLQNRGETYNDSGEYAKALADFQQALHLADRWSRPMVHRSLARLWATCPDAKFRDGKRAVRGAKKLLRGNGYVPPIDYDTLAAAYAESGDFEEAIKWQSKAVATAKGDDEFIRQLRERLELYRAGKPYREEPRQGGANAKSQIEME